MGRNDSGTRETIFFGDKRMKTDFASKDHLEPNSFFQGVAVMFAIYGIIWALYTASFYFMG